MQWVEQEAIALVGGKVKSAWEAMERYAGIIEKFLRHKQKFAFSRFFQADLAFLESV